MFTTSPFEEWKRFNDYVSQEKKNAVKSKWKFIGIYTLLMVSFPLVIGLSVITIKLAQKYAAMF